MNINIPIVLANSNNKVIITSSNVPNKPAANLRLIQNLNSTSSNSTSQPVSNKEHEFFKKYSKEIFVKYRSLDCEKRIDILQFNNDGSLEQNLNSKEMFIQRDRTQKIKTNQGPIFGAGTEFNKEGREEAWQRKFALNKKKQESKDPINLCIGRGRNMKKYKAVKESMFENSQYCVFIRSSSDCFEAVSVKDWYKMQPEVTSKFTKLEDAMEELNKLDKKLEMSSAIFSKRYTAMEQEEGVKTKKLKRQLNSEDDNEMYNGSGGLILTSNDRDQMSDSSVEEEREMVRKKKNAALLTKLRLGKERDYEESDLDDHQGDEVDYMTHSSSDEDNLPETEKEKIYTVNNVDEEVNTKSDDELSNVEEETKSATVNMNDESVKENEIESNADSDSSNDSSPLSSMEDSDEEDSNVILKQKLSSTINKNIANQMKSNARSQSSNTTSVITCGPGIIGSAVGGTGLSHLIDDPLKKFRQDSNAQNARIIQEMYKYLTRKPISKSNLFKKLISKRMISNDSQKIFDGLLEKINTVTHIVNGEKLFSILN